MYDTAQRLSLVPAADPGSLSKLREGYHASAETHFGLPASMKATKPAINAPGARTPSPGYTPTVPAVKPGVAATTAARPPIPTTAPALKMTKPAIPVPKLPTPTVAAVKKPFAGIGKTISNVFRRAV